MTTFVLSIPPVFVWSTWLRPIYDYELIKAFDSKAIVLLAQYRIPNHVVGLSMALSIKIFFGSSERILAKFTNNQRKRLAIIRLT